MQSQSKEDKILDGQAYFLVEPSYLNKLRHYCSSNINPNMETEGLTDKPLPKSKKPIFKSKAAVTKTGLPLRPSTKKNSIIV